MGDQGGPYARVISSSKQEQPPRGNCADEALAAPLRQILEHAGLGKNAAPYRHLRYVGLRRQRMMAQALAKRWNRLEHRDHKGKRRKGDWGTGQVAPPMLPMLPTPPMPDGPPPPGLSLGLVQGSWALVEIPWQARFPRCILRDLHQLCPPKHPGGAHRVALWYYS